MKPKHFAILGLYLVSMVLAFDVAPTTIHAQSLTAKPRYICINYTNGTITPPVIVSGSSKGVDCSDSDKKGGSVLSGEIAGNYFCVFQTVKNGPFAIQSVTTTTAALNNATSECEAKIQGSLELTEEWLVQTWPPPNQNPTPPTPNTLRFICKSNQNGEPYKVPSSGICPSGYSKNSTPLSNDMFCVYKSGDAWFASSSSTTCKTKNVQMKYDFKKLTDIPTSTQNPPTGQTNPPNPASTNDSITITQPFCVNGEGIVLPSDDNGCKLPPKAVVFSGQIDSRYLDNNKFYGLCFQIITDQSGQEAITLSAPSVNTSGTAACTSPARLIPKSDFNNFLGGTQGTTGQGTTGTGGTTGVTGGRGDCDPGFEPAGPLCLPKNPFGSNQGVAGSSSLMDIAVRVIKFLLMMSGIIAVAMMIYGGYQIMTAGGNPEQAKNGRKTLTNAVLGLIIVIFSYTVINVIVQYVITSR